MPEDIIHGEILPDGSVKVITGDVSPPNHDSAESLLSKIIRRTGGSGAQWSVDERHDKPIGHTHSHGERQHES